MTIVLPTPLASYDRTTAIKHKQVLEAADLQNRKKGTDIELGPNESLFMRSPAGTRWEVSVTDIGVVVAEAPGAAVPADAWSAFTPTITAGSGTFTTVSASGRYKQNGKTVHFAVTLTITTNGTAAGWVNATLPVTKRTGSGLSQFAPGWNQSTGAAIFGVIQATAPTLVSIFKPDGTYPGATGATLQIAGTYEAA